MRCGVDRASGRVENIADLSSTSAPLSCRITVERTLHNSADGCPGACARGWIVLAIRARGVESGRTACLGGYKSELSCRPDNDTPGMDRLDAGLRRYRGRWCTRAGWSVRRVPLRRDSIVVRCVAYPVGGGGRPCAGVWIRFVAGSRALAVVGNGFPVRQQRVRLLARAVSLRRSQEPKVSARGEVQRSGRVPRSTRCC